VRKKSVGSAGRKRPRDGIKARGPALGSSQAGVGQGASGRERRARAIPGGGAGGGRRGNRPAAKPGRRPGEPKGPRRGGGPPQAGGLVPPSAHFCRAAPASAGAPQARTARGGCEARGADALGTGAPARLRSARRGRAEARPPAKGGRAPRRGPGGSQNRKKRPLVGMVRASWAKGLAWWPR